MSHAEGGLEAAARLGRSKKVKEAAETWHWPPSSLRHPVTAAYRCVTISVLCLLCALFPGRWYPPYSASLRHLRHPMFDLVRCFVVSTSASPRVSWVVLAPPAGHRNTGLVCFFAPSLAFRLVLSCRPYVGLSPGHIIGCLLYTSPSPRD